MNKKKRLCIIVHPPIALTLMRKQWSYWMEKGFEVYCISGPSPQEHEKVQKMGVKTHVVSMDRFPNPLKDIISLLRIWWFLLWHRFDLIHVSVLKSSLLGSLAAWLSGHRRVIYLVRGRAYENMTGLKRKMMNFFEHLICLIAQKVVPISHELGEALVREELCAKNKIHVIGSGSSAGVDLSRFTRTKDNIAVGQQIREKLGIKPGDMVILFVGWLRRDKGINELVQAFDRLAKIYPGIHLILQGNYELKDPLKFEVKNLIENHQRIHHLPWREEPAPVYTLADIFAFPSYREGFGNVAMEAAAMELPVVASDIMGVREAVQKDSTGLLIPPAEVDALYLALKRLIDAPDLRHQLAQNGRRRMEKEFRQELIWQGTLEMFLEVLKT